MIRDLLRPTVVAALLLVVGALPARAHGSFWDDDATIHEGAIQAIADQGTTAGCNPPLADQYCPDRDVPRGQMAAFIARARDLPEAQADHFTDDEGSPFEDAINRVADAGITKGCNPPANDHFCPGRDIPRDEMAAFLDRAFDLPEAQADHFTDDEGNLFEDAINRVAGARITKGCNPPDNDHYCPDTAVPRDQMAAFLARSQDLATPAPTPADHELVIEYTIGTHGAPDRGSPAVFATRAHQALHSQVTMGEDGWNIQQRILFRPVESGGDLHLWLTDDDDVGEQAPVCDDAYSCTVGDDVFVNDENFATATSTWDHRPLPDYQRYVILHEVGHYLDFDGQTHYNDPAHCAPDGRAPVMMQQSIDRRGCQSNVWPLGFERDCVEAALLTERTEQNRDCPHR